MKRTPEEQRRIDDAIRTRYATEDRAKLAAELGYSCVDNMRYRASVLGVRRAPAAESQRNQILRERYPTCTDIPALARELGLSVNGMRSMASRLQVARDPAADHAARSQARINRPAKPSERTATMASGKRVGNWRMTVRPAHEIEPGNVSARVYVQPW